jgi:hypothetical protein
MFDEFNRHIGTENSALIVCGSEHIEGLTKLFGAAGPDVTNEDVTKARLVRSTTIGACFRGCGILLVWLPVRVPLPPCFSASPTNWLDSSTESFLPPLLPLRIPAESRQKS